MHRILICDDEPHVVEGIRFLLRGPDRQLEIARHGREALERIQAAVPDLLITDIMMPEMNGLDLVAALRAEEATQRLPIIILTAKAQIDDARLAQQVWGVTVIGKPFEPRGLKELVSTTLEGVACRSSS